MTTSFHQFSLVLTPFVAQYGEISCQGIAPPLCFAIDTTGELTPPGQGVKDGMDAMGLAAIGADMDGHN